MTMKNCHATLTSHPHSTLMLRQNLREFKGRCGVTQAFCQSRRAGARQFKADSHMSVFNIQTITRSHAAQESELANTLTLRIIEFFSSFLFLFF